MKLKVTIPPTLLTPLKYLKPIIRHHYFIASILLLSGIGVVIYMVNDTLNAPTDEAYRTELLKDTVGTRFNKTTQETINKVEALQRSSEQSQSQVLPPGRINPFAE